MIVEPRLADGDASRMVCREKERLDIAGVRLVAGFVRMHARAEPDIVVGFRDGAGTFHRRKLHADCDHPVDPSVARPRQNRRKISGELRIVMRVAIVSSGN